MVTLPGLSPVDPRVHSLSKETQHVNLCDQNSGYLKQYFD